MELVAIVTVLALVQYMMFSYQVGAVRVATEVSAPAMSGHPDFERMNRVHQNTLEQLAIYIPGMWMFGYFVDPMWAAGIGILFPIGRIMYRSDYLKDPSTRTRGFVTGFAVNSVFLIGSLVGAVLGLI